MAYGNGNNNVGSTPGQADLTPNTNTEMNMSTLDGSPVQIYESTTQAAPGDLQNIEETATDSSFTTLDSLFLNDISEADIPKTFGHPDDFIELHIYNTTGTLLFSDYNFKDYTVPPGQDCAPLTRTIDIDPEAILNSKGFRTGQFVIKLNILKNKVFDTTTYPFLIKQISSDNREIRSICTSATNAILKPAIASFLSEIETANYFTEFALNFSGDIIVPSINIAYDIDPEKHEVVLRTLQPLPTTVVDNAKFKIVEEIIDPLTLEYNMGDPVIVDDRQFIRGPNFRIDIKHNNNNFHL